MAFTEEEIRFPWGFAYLQMTLFEATYFSANARKFGFCFSRVLVFVYAYICVKVGKRKPLILNVGISRTQGSWGMFFNTFE